MPTLMLIQKQWNYKNVIIIPNYGIKVRINI